MKCAAASAYVHSMLLCRSILPFGCSQPATRSKMNSGILEFTAHAVGLRCNGRHLKQIIDLHLAERTVPRVKNWTTGE